jgi:AbiV family abortive infection protein
VKEASRPELAACAIAVARNAQGLLHDAEVLAGAGCTARAYSLAVLAVEACGKAGEFTALAVMPEGLRARAPVGRMLEWHQLKLVGGLLVTVLPLGGVSSWLAVMPADELAQTLSILDVPADEADRLKRRGFYVDLDRGGRIREPSEITGPELTRQLERARQAAASVASALLGPHAQTRLAHPPATGVELVEELVTALTEAGHARTPKAAADVIVKAVTSFRARKGISDLGGYSAGQFLLPRSRACAGVK